MDIEALRQSVRGTVIAAADADYPAAKDALIWNGRKPARAPFVIVRAAGVADVQAAVRFAARHGLPVSARGYGHNWSGIARQEAVVIDLAALNDIAVDAAGRIASVGPAATSGTLARALAEHGLAFPVGHCATVPMSGFLLGGGLGWNSGAWGVATWSIESADVVLADGVLRQVITLAHPDVFWALQGGGPEFFGVVTGYRLRLQPLPRAITTSVRIYPKDRLAAVEAWTTAAMGGAPATLELTVLTSRTPGPDGTRGDPTIAVVATIFADDPAEAAAELARIDAGAPDGALAVVPPAATPFDALFDDLGRFFPAGRRYAVDSFWANGPISNFVQQMSRRAATAPSAESFAFTVVSPPADPALAEMPYTAFSMVGQAFGAAYAVWQDPAEDAAQIAWLRGTADVVAPATVGHYVGEADHDREGRLERCFSPEAWQRLKALQATYDPHGLFARRRPALLGAA